MGKWVGLDSVIESVKEERVKVYSRALTLAEKGYLENRLLTSQRTILTPRGKDALERGVIERLILDYLIQNKTSQKVAELPAEELGLDPRELSAAIGILKKLSYINLQSGEVIVSEKGLENYSSPLPAEMVLRRISRGEAVPIDEEQTKTLSRRGLIATEEIKSLEIKITMSGLKALERVKKEGIIRERLSKVTPEMLTNGSWKEEQFTPYDITVSPGKIHLGKKHQYLAFLDYLKRELVRMGFIEMEGPLVELEWWNFDVLYQPQDHPAREWTDGLSVKRPARGIIDCPELIKKVKATHETGWKTGSSGWRYSWDIHEAEKLVLRPQGTVLSARYMVDLTPPVKYFSVARCFRYDTVDSVHLAEFNQIEGIVAAKDLTMKDLLGMLKFFAEEIGGVSKFTFMPDTYPFTEPSVQLIIDHPTLGKVEFGGAGMFRDEVTKPLGVDVPVIAWGLGLDRIYMSRYNIRHIRQLFTKDLSLLRNQEVI